MTVWFDAWKYDRERYLALIPFLRQLNILLRNVTSSNTRSREGAERTLNALMDSVDLNVGIGSVVSAHVSFDKFKESLKADPSLMMDGQKISMHQHPTDHLAFAIQKLRDKYPKTRIVVFIDDLDRCFPDKALEVLESIKAFLDIDGIVYVIAMDSNSIDTILKNKYGEKSTVKGLDYLQKIVQLPFQVPTWKDGWKDEDITKSIDTIMSTELKEYPLVGEIRNNIDLIVKGVQLNPREIKRFINSVTLAVSVFFPDHETLSIKELIAVQALSFRSDWKNFLDIITPDDSRTPFLYRL